MVSSEYILTFLCLICGLYLYLKRRNKNKSSLPGPRGLPFLGNVLQIGFQPHVKFMQWAKIYGPIFGIKMGMQEAFVVNDVKLIRELLNDHASAGRMLDNPVILAFTKGSNNGISNSEGVTWDQQRRFATKTLKSFGFAKTSMEHMIMDEVQTLLQYFRNSNEKPIPGNGIFIAPVVNSLWRMVSGERCAWEKGHTRILQAADELLPVLNEVGTNGLMFAPVLRFIAPEYFGWNRWLKALNTFFTIFGESIEQHKKTFDENNLRDYIDHFLLEVRNTKDPESSFYKTNADNQLEAGLLDLFVAGSETTSSTLSWALLYLSQYPKVQERMQKEIDKALEGQLPTLQDKYKLPYTEALYSEISRLCTVTPLAIPHCMLEDKLFYGHLLKKGTPFFVNIYGVHHDESVWGDPEVFRPERFLNEDGTKFVRNPALIPFSEGKRKCAGEQLAKDSTFLFLASILQEFSILPEDPKQAPDLEPGFGLLIAPKPFKVVVVQRKRSEILNK